LSASEPLPALAWLVVRAPAGGGHPEQPEAGRRLVVVLSGEREVIASGETVTGFEALMIILPDL
jgi:hypothetical protein